MTLRLFMLNVLLALFSACCFCQDTTKPFVKVEGEVTKPLFLYADDLAKIKQTTATMKEHDNKEYSYTGVAVQEVLQMAGVTTGKELRGQNLTKYMLVKCADGYQVLFSLAELDNSFNDRKIILVYQSESKALPIDKGPFRLVVAGEKRPARSCLQVTGIIIRSAKEKK